MTSPPLRVHIHNDASQDPSLFLSPEIFEKALADHPALVGKVSATYGLACEPLPAAMADAEIMFTATKLSLKEARAHAPGLRWTQSMSAGIEAFLPGMPADMILTNASGVHGEKGGEFVLAGALMLAYALPQFIADKMQEAWKPVYLPMLRDRTILVLGTGSIGTGSAQALKSRGCHVVGFNSSGTHPAPFDEVIGLDGLDAALSRTDILVSTLPLTPHTKLLIDRRRMGLLPAGAGVIVVGRADVLDYDAMVDLLYDGTLCGAVLDVFPEEPVSSGDRLWRTPRLVMTPHCSVDDHSHYLQSCLAIFLDNLERFTHGRPLRNVVDPSAGY